MKKRNQAGVRKFIIATISIVAIIFIFSLFKKTTSEEAPISNNWWGIQSIDTMKYSRDLAKEKLSDPAFNRDIDVQVKNIAGTGANYIAIATPYDPEFLPFLKQWVVAARKYNLHIWYRGNWSAWEGWFDHNESISFDDHIQKSVKFINDNPDLFQDGDSFTPCPECENGKNRDPRQTGNVAEYRQFLISEYQQTTQAFQKQNKQVYTNWYSMNKDVADLVMDPDTSSKMGGLVVIDHYVEAPSQISKDVTTLAQKSHAKIMLGEFGAPIPNLNGNQTEVEQAAWIDQALAELAKNPNLIGINYWTSKGGSTGIWNEDNSPRRAVNVFNTYFKPKVITGTIKNDMGDILTNIQISNDIGSITNQSGAYIIKVLQNQTFTFSKDGYESNQISFSAAGENQTNQNIVLKKTNPSFGYTLRGYFKKFF